MALFGWRTVPLFVENLVHPQIELRFVGENTSPHRAVHSVDGQPELRFPTPARSLGASEICGNLFPGLEEVAVRHQSGLRRIVESPTAWVVDRIGTADHNMIVILVWRFSQ